jgi:hypothetical protein
VVVGRTAARAQVDDVAEPDVLEQLGQAPVRAVELEPPSAPGRGDLESCQRIDGVEVGWHQPRDIEVDGGVTGPGPPRCRPARPGETVSWRAAHGLLDLRVRLQTATGGCL